MKRKRRLVDIVEGQLSKNFILPYPDERRHCRLRDMARAAIRAVRRWDKKHFRINERIVGWEMEK